MENHCVFLVGFVLFLKFIIFLINFILQTNCGYFHGFKQYKVLAITFDMLTSFMLLLLLLQLLSFFSMVAAAISRNIKMDILV